MRVAFRQGLVQAPVSFLQLTPTRGVTLNVPPAQAVVVNFAQGYSNYLLTVQQQVTNAWPGPFTPGTDYWLYWDIDTVTGAVSYNYTIRQPVYGNIPPPAPQTDQHWFDTSTFTMKVWNGARWINRIRVFAAKLQAGAIFVSMSINSPVFTGTQAGFAGQVAVNSGAINYDVFGKPIRKSNNEFFTTEDYAVAGAGSAVQVKTASLLVEARATEPIPAYYVVRFTAFNEVSLASNYLLDNGIYGIVEVDVDQDEPCNVVTEGVIDNPNWDWSAYPVNTPLYVGPTGELTTVLPPIAIPVAAIVDKHTILLRPSSLFLGGPSAVATQSQLGNVLISLPSVPPPAVRNIIAVTPGVNGTFTITGNWAEDLMIARQFSVTGNTNPGTNTTYSVTSAANIGPNTVITVASPVVPVASTATGFATFNQLPRVITQDDPRLGGGGGSLTPAEQQFLSTVVLDGPGIVVLDPLGNGVTRTLIAPPAGITITNPDGSGGDPTFALSDDLAAVEGLITSGFTVRTGTSTWATRSVTGTLGTITVTNGSGILGNPVINLSTVGTPVTNSFSKFTTDIYGRITATTSVTTSDITALVDGTYVNVSGDTMTGVLNMGTNKIINLGAPTDPDDAATKAYVDSMVGPSAPNQIYQLDSSVTVTDTGTDGQVTTVIDGVTVITTDINGTVFNQDVTINGVTYPLADGTTGQFIVTDGVGQLSFITLLGNMIDLGLPTDGSFLPGAVPLTVTTKVTDAIDDLNEILAKLIPPAPPNFPGSQTLTISTLSSYRMTSFVQTDHTTTGSKQVTGGTVVNSVRRTNTYTTNIINDTGPGDSGTVTLFKNSSSSGSVVMTVGNNDGVYGDLVITNNVDYGTITAQPTGFWESFDANGSGTVVQGWNELYINHSAAGATNTPVWYYDASAPGVPQFTLTSITPPGVPALSYSSTIPHYTTANAFTISFNVNRLTGDMFPLSNTFVTGTAGGAFVAPLSRTYADVGLNPTTLPRNLYVASGSQAVTTTAAIKSGTGSSSVGPQVSVVNSYNTGSNTFNPGATVLYMTGVDPLVVNELNIPVNTGVGSGDGVRIENPGSTDTPVLVSTTTFNSSLGPLYTYDSTVVGGILKHDTTNYSTGYLPAGPNLSVGRSGTQYFTFKFTRTVVSKFDVKFSGTVAGMWVALPGSLIDTTSTLNGWLDMSVAYLGAGVPGAGPGGNGSNGCTIGGSVPLNTLQTNKRVTATFGTESSSTTLTNEIIVRIALTTGQTITSLSIEGASN